MADTKSIHTPCNSWAPPEVIQDLHESQSGDGRHKCVACAYQRGYEQGKAELDAAIEARIAAIETSICALEAADA